MMRTDRRPRGSGFRSLFNRASGDASIQDRVEERLQSMSISLAFLLGFSGFAAAQQCPAPTHRRIPYDAEDPPEHRIQLKTRAYRDGGVLWLGGNVTMQALRDRLRSWRSSVPTPYLVLEYEEGIDCATLANLRRLFDEDGGCGDETVCSERQIPARVRLIRRQAPMVTVCLQAPLRHGPLQRSATSPGSPRDMMDRQLNWM
jgi:hypothetical protein